MNVHAPFRRLALVQVRMYLSNGLVLTDSEHRVVHELE